MKYVILAPANIQSGGPELAHQLCYKLNAIGRTATMYYCSSDGSHPVDIDAMPKYQKYNTKHEINYEEVDLHENIVIVPEGLISFALGFSNARIAIWWMSVDNIGLPPELIDNALIYFSNRATINLVQSFYAYDYLYKKGIDTASIIYLTDYIGKLYKKDIASPNNRKNIILYNPAKGLELLAPYIASHTNYEWKPLYGFSEEEMVNEMQHAKLYIDFGSHPGKDRIPREAASCGCVIITNRKGSAAYFEDVPIQDKYKFESPEKSYEELTTLIDDVFVNFSEHFSIFSKYREIIRKDEETFNTEVLDFVTAMEI